MLNDAKEFKAIYNAFVVSTHTKEGRMDYRDSSTL